MWAGKTTINSEPFPNSETTFISPPKESTIFFTNCQTYSGTTVFFSSM